MSNNGSVGIVKTKHWRFAKPPSKLRLRCGQALGPIDIAYETCGDLTPERDNTILLCHPPTGDASAAERHDPDNGGANWWDIVVGPGDSIDTDRSFVICADCIGYDPNTLR